MKSNGEILEWGDMGKECVEVDFVYHWNKHHISHLKAASHWLPDTHPSVFPPYTSLCPSIHPPIHTPSKLPLSEEEWRGFKVFVEHSMRSEWQDFPRDPLSPLHLTVETLVRFQSQVHHRSSEMTEGKGVCRAGPVAWVWSLELIKVERELTFHTSTKQLKHIMFSRRLTQ